MSIVPILWVAWATFTLALVVLLLYRNSLTRNEDDTLSLETSGASHQQQQEMLLAKVHRIEPAVRVALVGTVVMTIGVAGFYLWDLLKHIML